MNYWRFWASFATLTTLSLSLAGFYLNDKLAARPARPDLPNFGHVFISVYTPAGSAAAQDIFFHGLFGVGERIRNSDLFVVGSSHVEFGLSARQASALLTRNGQPVRAFNLAAGCGETVQFGLDALGRNAASGGIVVADGLTLDPAVSLCGQAAERRDTVQAYVSVLTVWSKALYDWALDPVLPRFALEPQGTRVERFLSGILYERDWQSGDAVLVWEPNGGMVYPSSTLPEEDVAEKSRAFGVDWNLGESRIFVPESIRRQASALHMDLAATFIPFVPDYAGATDLYRRIASWTMAAPDESTRCFAGISAEGVRSFDSGQHLTREANAIATDRLAESLVAHGCAGLSLARRPSAETP